MTSTSLETDLESKSNLILPFVLLFAAGLMVRMVRLFEIDFNFDEAVLLFQIDKSFGDIWEFCKTDNYPPLYPWMLKIWGYLGRSDAWFRLFGALMGATVGPAAYLLGRELKDHRTGWLLGLVSAVSVPLIFYSQYVRMFNIQPTLTVLSVYWFIRALKTDDFKFWLWVALINLIGFYVYIFTLFLVFAQFLVVVGSFRMQFKRYRKPLLAGIPFLIGVLIWIVPVLIRYSDLRSEGFWAVPFTLEEVVKVWTFICQGSDFRDHYMVAFLLNLPFLIGFIWGLKTGWHDFRMRVVSFIFLSIALVLTATTLLGQSFFAKPYFVFIIPACLAIVVIGWMSLERKIYRHIGVISLAFSLLLSLMYYYIDIYKLKEFWGFMRPLPMAESGEGHALTNLIADLDLRYKDGDAIIHFSGPVERHRIYFTSLYYHQRSKAEYIYSKDPLTNYNGKQYLEAGDWIRHLDDIKPPPESVWLVTMLDPQVLFDKEVLAGRKRPSFIFKENLPAELAESGYRYLPEDDISYGKVTVLHFVKNATSNGNLAKGDDSSL